MTVTNTGGNLSTDAGLVLVKEFLYSIGFEQLMEKEQPFKIRYQLFDSSATNPITDKKMTKTISHSYRKGAFTQATYEQISQLKDKGVQHTMQKVNERELE